MSTVLPASGLCYSRIIQVREWVGQAATAVENAFDRVTPMRAILATFVAALVIVHGLVPGFTIDGMTISLLGLLAILVLTPLLRSASFLGNKLEFVERLREDARAFRKAALQLPAERVILARPEAVPAFANDERAATPAPKALDVVARPERALESEDARSKSPEEEPVVGHTTDAELLAEAHGSPRLALLRLTDHLEDATSRLLARHGQRPTTNLIANTRQLVDTKRLPPTAADTMRQFARVRNQIIHGNFSSDDDVVLATLDIGVSILNTIELIESGPMPDPDRESGD